MKAVRIHNHGGIEVLQVEEIPVPEPGPDQICVHLKTSALNHLDIWVRKGIPGVPLPIIMGSDGAGNVCEVGAGVNKTLLKEISEAIIRLNKEKNYTFFVIEHDMDLIEKLCEPVIVMAEGKVLFQGSFDKVKSNEEVIEAYLGKGMKQKENLKS